MKQFFAYFLIIFITTFNVFAHEPNAAVRRKWLQHELKLSPEQRENIQSILKKYQVQLDETLKAANASQNDLRLSFKTANRGTGYNKELLKKFDHYRELRTHYRRVRFLMALEIRQNLNADQLAIFHSLTTKR